MSPRESGRPDRDSLDEGFTPSLILWDFGVVLFKFTRYSPNPETSGSRSQRLTTIW
jgi:hypothetical protein